MSNDQTHTPAVPAVIDRFEGAVAVLLVGADQQVVDVPRDQLPRDAQPGQWLRVVWDGDAIRQITLDHDATAAAQQRIATKLARLRRGDHLREP